MPNLRQSLTAAVTKRYPFFSECGSLVNSSLIRLVSSTRGGKAWCRVPGGEVLADLDDHVGGSAFYVGDLNRKITWICRKIVRNGDTVLDVGAKIRMVTVCHLTWMEKMGMFIASSQTVVVQFESGSFPAPVKQPMQAAQSVLKVFLYLKDKEIYYIYCGDGRTRAHEAPKRWC